MTTDSNRATAAMPENAWKGSLQQAIADLPIPEGAKQYQHGFVSAKDAILTLIRQAQPVPASTGREELIEVRDSIASMLLHFTRTPSTLADSMVRGRCHTAIDTINRILAAPVAARELDVEAERRDTKPWPQVNAEAIAAQNLLDWNRAQAKRPIEVTKELGVARKAFELLAAAQQIVAAQVAYQAAPSNNSPVGGKDKA